MSTMRGTTETGNIVDTIDGALHHWAMSSDAMRWSPDAVHAPALPVLEVDVAHLAVSMAAFGESFTRAGEQLSRALKQAGCAFPAAFRRAAPPPGPPALCIDGHEYRRRSRGRRR